MAKGEGKSAGMELNKVTPKAASSGPTALKLGWPDGEFIPTASGFGGEEDGPSSFRIWLGRYSLLFLGFISSEKIDL